MRDRGPMGEGCGGPQEPPEGGLTLALALATVLWPWGRWDSFLSHLYKDWD